MEWKKKKKRDLKPTYSFIWFVRVQQADQKGKVKLSINFSHLPWKAKEFGST